MCLEDIDYQDVELDYWYLKYQQEQFKKYNEEYNSWISQWINEHIF